MEEIFRTFVASVIRWALKPPAKPGQFALNVVGETTMARANVTVVTLPVLAEGNPGSVVERKFTTTAGDSVNVSVDTPTVTVNLVQGVEVTLKLVDVDQAGNESAPSELTFTPSDVTPPEQPGPFLLQVTGEVEV